MNKSELIKIIAEEANISQNQARIVIETIKNEISSTLKKGEKVRLSGFGTWSLSKRNESIGRNPQTGKPIRIAAKVVVCFKSSEILNKTSIKEHDIVELTEDLLKVPLVTGTKGTIVHIYPNATAYEVEFVKKDGSITVETVEPHQILKSYEFKNA